MIPFLGTSLGAACVFVLRGVLKRSITQGLSGFAAGVMVAASVWSLLIPAMEMASPMGAFSFVPGVAGFAIGVVFLMLLDRLIPHLHVNENEPEGHPASYRKTTMLVLAVTLHNIPEGMAVGVVFAGVLAGNTMVTMSGAFALAIGIAIQNFPEGAIVSMPMVGAGATRRKAFGYGVASGIVEPLGAAITIWLSGYLIPILPYLLSFAAGAMMYVVVEELVPEAVEGKHSHVGTIAFAAGFLLMMALDVALG